MQLNEIIYADRLLACELEHVFGHTVVTTLLVQLCHHREVFDDVRRQTALRRRARSDLGGCLSVRHGCIASLVVLADLTTAAVAGTDINCTIREVVVEEGLGKGASSTHEKSLTFWLDDASKTITLADGVALTVTRFDDNWISAKHGSISFEFDRKRDRLSYASATERNRMTTLIIGSGRCESGPH
jgi:hypothetical protein